MPARRRILVTSALPYANGPIHLGYVLEAVQTDVWVRFQRLRGHECYYVGADDTHGTPVMLKAQAEGVTPEALIARVNEEHRRDLAELLIGFDNYGSTHSPENEAHCDRMYRTLRAREHIGRRLVRQAYDESAGMFLPDRYVKGTCPNCGAANQNGDSCENCGATYTPADLKDPISVISGTTPVWRESEHYFFLLNAFESRLKKWIGGGAVQDSVAHKLDEWFAQGLKDWDISRDAPYFGFQIPDAPGKYFYVWFDAPIGYLASFTQLCERTGLLFEDFFAPDSRAELRHFIGKDILYFHTLFWPAVLEGSGQRPPTAVHTHGFLTINGHKMSKSRGTFITARRYLERFKPEPLRYYLAAKLGPGIEDIDMNLEEFATRVNADLVGKLVNIASRCAGFVTKSANGVLAESLPDEAMYRSFIEAGERIATAYEASDTAAAIREIMALADRANQYIDLNKPWSLAKQPERAAEVLGVCTQGINCFRALMIYLTPVLPDMAAQARQFLNETEWRWESVEWPLLGTLIRPYQPLATRLDPKAVARLIEPEGLSDATPTTPTMPTAPGARSGAASGTPHGAPPPAASTAAPAARPTPGSSPPAAGERAGAPAKAPVAAQAAPAASVTLDEFLRIDLRIARILAAEHVAGADKLLKLKVDVGELGERELFAGVRAAYDPATLVGRLIVVVANLEPRRMRFGVSAGMMLAAGPGGADIFIVSPDAGAAPGMRVK